MRSKTIIALFLVCAFALSAQSKKYLNVELMGAGGAVGISFDSRFKADSKFGYKVGLGYGFEYNSGVSHWYFTPVKAYYPEDKRWNNNFSIPVNAYYLFGREKHFFEMGLGFSLFYADYDFGSDSKIGYHMFGRVAYRHESQSKRLKFSVGLDLPFRTPASGLGYSIALAPSISIGYRL